MTCNNCARHAQEALAAIPGVAGVTVRLEAGTATIRWQPSATPDENLVRQALRQAGFDGKPVVHAAGNSAPKTKPTAMNGWQVNVLLGSTVTVILMACEWGLGVGMQRWFHWLAFALALPVQLVCGARFYQGAWRQLKAGHSNMDTLVSLGSTVAFAYSVWGLVQGGTPHLFFLESAAIITLISIGHWIEARASAKVASALEAMLHLTPATARRLQNMTETEVPVATLQMGDSVVLKPGDRVPVDGTVAFGGSAVDESMLSGESLPIDKNRGDKLYAGTLNQSGRLVMRVTATGEATALARIITVVEHAQQSRAAIQRLGDRVSSVFVPVVILIALATAALWFWNAAGMHTVQQWASQFLWAAEPHGNIFAAAIMHAVGVLIIACPCAMGLATPVAIMAGTNAAARRGILIRDGQALEKSGHITAVLFDKTGTLTTGKVSVAAVQDLRAKDERTVPVETLAASLAQASTHPLSQAVARLLTSPALALNDWREIRGCGVQAVTAADPALTLRLGSLSWLAENGVELAPAQSFTDTWSQQGASLLGLARGNQLLGIIALSDTLKPAVGDVVRLLTIQGKKVFLVTGDHASTATAIAREAGIPATNVFAGVRPENKAQIVSHLQQQGERVAFVGDGINDAPALEHADLGIAVSRACDVARDAADIVLIKSDLHGIPEALDLAQATLRTIKQNLFWAFFYNAAAVPLAALGFFNPMVCAAAMGLSDIAVIGNALRLNRRHFLTPPKA
ncbi:MAG: heavy metal translocating P-type ATPase [Verrucomicrobiota bacterium]